MHDRLGRYWGGVGRKAQLPLSSRHACRSGLPLIVAAYYHKFLRTPPPCRYQDSSFPGHANVDKHLSLSFHMTTAMDDTLLTLRGGDAMPEVASMWRKGEMTDQRVVVGCHAFECHRLVLVANSGYFRLRFLEAAHAGFSDSSGPVFLEELDATIFAAMCEFFYVGLVRIPLESLQPLVLAASRFQAVKLLDVCIDAVRTLLNVDNCQGILQLAEAISRPDLAKPAAKLLAREVLPARFDRGPPPSRPGDAINLTNLSFAVQKLREHPESIDIAVAVCNILTDLSATRFLTREMLSTTNAVSAVVAAMSAHHGSLEVGAAAATTLAGIARMPLAAILVVDAGGVQTMVKLIAEHEANPGYDAACLPRIPTILDVACRAFFAISQIISFNGTVSSDDRLWASCIKAEVSASTAEEINRLRKALVENGVPSILRFAMAAFAVDDELTRRLTCALEVLEP